MSIGTVISTMETPTTGRFHFVIAKDAMVRKGQFVQIDMNDGKLIGRVSDIAKINKYFARPESVSEYDKSGSNISELFPADDWEYLVAETVALGVFTETGFTSSTFPPSPGQKVIPSEELVLKKFFGIDDNGLNIGKMPMGKTEVKLNITKLFQKHLAILAMSGAGKSFLTAVLIEEILKRDKVQSPAIIMIDTHGEYTVFGEDEKFSDMTRIFPINDLKIDFSKLSAHYFKDFGLTVPQERELQKVLNDMKGNYGVTDLIDKIDETDMNTKSKDAIMGILDQMRRTGLFGANDYPLSDELVKQGRLSIIDLSKSINISTKRMIVANIANRLFMERRAGKIPPFILILEEAHQYIPEKVKKEYAKSKIIMETIAREGRKFQASICLISQRPVHLSATVLSQCNSKIILRVTNPNDLNHIQESSESITNDVKDQITSLPVGQGYIVGEAVNFPLLVKVRNRESKESDKGKSIELASKEFFEKREKERKDSRAFV